MNWSLECSLDPILTNFLQHVQTDHANDPEAWVQKALEFSTPVYKFLGNAMLAGFELSGDIQRVLDKVLDILVMCKAKEEEKIGGARPVNFGNFDPKASGIQLEIVGLAPDASLTQYLPVSLLKYLAETSSNNVRYVTLNVPSGYPMVYTLDNLRRVLLKISGVTVQWQGVDRWRPDMALEVVVPGVNNHYHKTKLDLLIEDYLGEGSILYSRLDTSLDMYRVIIADPMNTDRILGSSIPFGSLQFQLLHHIAKQTIAPEDWPMSPQLPVPLEVRKLHLQLPCGVKHYHTTAADAHALEKDLFFFVYFYMDHPTRQKFGPLRPKYYRDPLPRRVESGSPTPSPMYHLHDALCNVNWPEFEVALNSINSLISNLPLDTLGKAWGIPPKPLSDHILADLYHRNVVPHLSEIKLDNNISGSTKEVTYGELHSPFVDRILNSVRLDKTSTFWDLGCGVGNITLQVNLQTGCQSFGLELLPVRVRIAKALADEYKAACTMWGFSVGDVGIEHGDLRDDQFWDRIKSADLILVNNLVFEPATDLILWGKLQSIKLGASVVVLKQLEVNKRGGKVAHGMTQSGEDTSFSINSIQSGENEVSWHGHEQIFYIYRKGEADFFFKNSQELGSNCNLPVAHPIVHL